MDQEIKDTHQKAFEINEDPQRYGTFAEIGAGQEVARWFFRVGGASQTIAKSMSAYDMTMSDAIYGKTQRYVSRARLSDMLDHEWSLLLERLGPIRGDSTCFFAFANTVAAKSLGRKGENHGWLGIRFLTEPKAEPSQIIIHVRLLDYRNLDQQEALGIIGVNLIHGAYCLHDQPVALIRSLLDSLNRKRVEVDMIKFTGPAFEGVDNRLMALTLVEHRLTDATMFTAEGEVVQPGEALYEKPILVERGSFRPVTRTTLEMLECAQAQFVQEPQVQDKQVVVLMEMTLKNLLEGDHIDHKDFLDRVDLLGALGKNVLISNYAEFHRLAGYLFRYTKEKVGLVMGIPTLKEIFQEKYYTDLDGGILESFGRLFKNDLKLYVLPLRESANGALITAENLCVEPHLRHLYSHLMENCFIEPLRGFDEANLSTFSRDALAKIRAGDSEWEQMVPEKIAALIKERGLFGCATPA
ncbi:MAG: hypothetical protein ACI9VS_002449 [Candidatus Binatia bacterium]|jgi:hypothetical protein